MKILHIIDSLGLGGAQTVVKGIFEAQKDNEDIHLFSLRKKEIETKIDHRSIFVFDSIKKYSFAPLFELKKKIESEKINVLHCHLFKSQVFGWLLKLVWFPEIKLIFHEHGEIFYKHPLYIMFLKLSKNKVDKYLAVSKETERLLSLRASIKKEVIQVLYNFVDLKKFGKENIVENLEKERGKLGFDKNDFVVGFAGRLVEVKGWREFLEAAAILKNESSVKFIIAGSGEQEAEVEILIDKLGLTEKVHYVGYCSNMVWFYSVIDCFVMPSHFEPMGLTEIEAQAMGVPVVVSDVPALNEIIDDGINGLLFISQSVEDLTDKINYIKNNPGVKNKMVENGLNSVKKHALPEYIKVLNFVYAER